MKMIYYEGFNLQFKKMSPWSPVELYLVNQAGKAL